MASAKILFLVTYCALVYGQDNVKLPILLNQMLTGDESSSQHSVLELVTDSPKDILSESTQPMQPDQSIELTDSSPKENLIMQPELMEQTTQLNNLTVNITSESLGQQTTSTAQPNLNPTPNKNITIFHTNPFINTITYIITLSTYGNSSPSFLPPLPSISGLLTKLLSGNLPGFLANVNQSILTNISTTVKPISNAPGMAENITTNMEKENNKMSIVNNTI